MRRAGALLGGLLALACGGWPPFSGSGDAPAPSAEAGIQLVDDPAVFEFYTRASAFYGRLARRRFDSIETYQDEALRDFFRDEAAYADYYADLTGALVEAHFEKNRPVELEVLELRVDGPGRARVLARIHGDDGRPLRPGRVHLDRDDRWERVEGRWRIEPSRR